jgi:hypothetical protein
MELLSYGNWKKINKLVIKLLKGINKLLIVLLLKILDCFYFLFIYLLFFIYLFYNIQKNKICQNIYILNKKKMNKYIKNIQLNT